MGQLLSLAVPITDDPETTYFSNNKYQMSVGVPRGETMSRSLTAMRYTSQDREIEMANHYHINDNDSTLRTPRENWECCSVTDPMLQESVRNNMVSSCSTSFKRKIIEDMVDKFATFEFLLYSCVASVMSYNLGYKRDAKYDYFHAKTDIDKIIVAEDYYRGIIQNGFHSLMQIITMAIDEILPALEKIRSVDKQEFELWKHEYDDLPTLDWMNSEGGPSYNNKSSGGTNRNESKDIVIVSTQSMMTALDRHQRPINGNWDSSSPSGGGRGRNTNRNNTISNRKANSSSYSCEPPIVTLSTPLVSAERENISVYQSDPEKVAIIKQLTGKNIDVSKKQCKCDIVVDSVDFLNCRGSVDQLNRGDGYFFFHCKALNQCTKENLDYFGRFINMTSFDNEEVQNACPVVNVYDDEVQRKYISIMVKSMYVLPGVRYTDICAELMATKEYNKACQSGDIKMLDTDAPFTFRQQKTIIKFVFSLVIQFKVSEITDPEELGKFTTVDGITPSRIILLERTKRNINTEDSTVKCKSVLLYYQINGGVLVSHTTVILNRSIPTLLSKLMDNLGGKGSGEAGETANKTRKYLIEQFGDSRKN